MEKDFKKNKSRICYFDEKENVKKYIVFFWLKEQEEMHWRDCFINRNYLRIIISIIRKWQSKIDPLGSKPANHDIQLGCLRNENSEITFLKNSSVEYFGPIDGYWCYHEKGKRPAPFFRWRWEETKLWRCKEQNQLIEPK